MTSWVDASHALYQVSKERVKGSVLGLSLRSHIEALLYRLGETLERNRTKSLFVCLLLLTVSCIGLKAASFEDDPDKLWIPSSLSTHRDYEKSQLGDGFAGTGIQLLLQRRDGGSLLTSRSLLRHRDALINITRLQLELFGTTWSLSDLCMKPELPLGNADEQGSVLLMLAENLLPCLIVTPLDCFWDGALVADETIRRSGILRGPRWSTLDPIEYIQSTFEPLLTSRGERSYLDTALKTLKEFGLTHGYMDRPCLDGDHPPCPARSQNVGQVDISRRLSGGCSSWLRNKLHWAEALVVGGVQHGPDGKIIRAEALQSSLLLMSAENLYDLVRHSVKLDGIDGGWSVDRARSVLARWSQSIRKVIDPQLFTTLGSGEVERLLSRAPSGPTAWTALGASALTALLCALVSGWRLYECRSGQKLLAICLTLGSVLVIVAGLGLSATVGVRFTAASVTVMPALCLSFILLHQHQILATYMQLLERHSPAHQTSVVGRCYQKTGPPVLLSLLVCLCGFVCTMLIDVPLLRCMILQACVVTLTGAVGTFLLTPLMLAVDLRRHEEGNSDMLPCCVLSTPVTRLSNTSNSTELATVSRPSRLNNEAMPRQSATTGRSETVAGLNGHGDVITVALPKINNWDRQRVSGRTSRTANTPLPTADLSQYNNTRIYWCQARHARLIQFPTVAAVVLLLLISLTAVSLYGVMHLSYGINFRGLLASQHPPVASAVGTRQDFFANDLLFLAFDRGANDITLRQRELLELDARIRSDWKGRLITRGQPVFWLRVFRSWLSDLQLEFDRSVTNCSFDLYDPHDSKSTWYDCASAKARLAFKLLVQSGRGNVGTNRILNRRLVQPDGSILPHLFYLYLSAWASNDRLGLAESQSDLRPAPKTWVHDPFDRYQLQIPRSSSLTFWQVPFLFSHQNSTEAIIDTLRYLDEVCRGRGCWVRGHLNNYYRVYTTLRMTTLAAAGLIAGCALIAALTTCRLFLVIILVCAQTLHLLHTSGIGAVVGISTNPFSCLALLLGQVWFGAWAVGLSWRFVSGTGTTTTRAQTTLMESFRPLVLSSCCATLMLLPSAFTDILLAKLLVLPFLLSLTVSLIDLLILQVMLGRIGPASQTIPLTSDGTVAPPTPPPASLRSGNKVFPRRSSRYSLTTIDEEPSQIESDNEDFVSGRRTDGDASSAADSSVQSKSHVLVDSCQESSVTRVTTTVQIELAQ